MCGRTAQGLQSRLHPHLLDVRHRAPDLLDVLVRQVLQVARQNVPAQATRTGQPRPSRKQSNDVPPSDSRKACSVSLQAVPAQPFRHLVLKLCIEQLDASVAVGFEL